MTKDHALLQSSYHQRWIFHADAQPGAYLTLTRSCPIPYSYQSNELLLTHQRLVHTGFLRPCLISHVNMPRPERSKAEDQSIWIPYPTHREARPSYLTLYFDEACNLSTIARDISRSMFAPERDSGFTGFELVPRQSREELFERLKRWHDLLPGDFADYSKPPPHLVLLKSVCPCVYPLCIREFMLTITV